MVRSAMRGISKQDAIRRARLKLVHISTFQNKALATKRPEMRDGRLASKAKLEGSQIQDRALLVVLKPNRIIHKCTDANYSSFDLRVFLWLSNPQGQRQTSTLSIPRDNFGERKAKFNLETSRSTQM
jgi:hypothetical protein